MDKWNDDDEKLKISITVEALDVCVVPLLSLKGKCAWAMKEPLEEEGEGGDVS